MAVLVSVVTLLLFLLPILCAGAEKVRWLSLLFSWKEEEICGGFCFAAFFILVPVCLRQSLFWLRNLTDTTMEAEERMLRKYQMQLQYKHRNRRLYIVTGEGTGKPSPVTMYLYKVERLIHAE